MKKVIFALSFFLFVGTVSATTSSTASDVQVEVQVNNDDDDKKKKKKKKTRKAKKEQQRLNHVVHQALLNLAQVKRKTRHSSDTIKAVSTTNF